MAWSNLLVPQIPLSWPVLFDQFGTGLGASSFGMLNAGPANLKFLHCPTKFRSMPGKESASNSVTLWLSQLKAGSDEAAAELWRRYFTRLVELARSSLRNAPRRISDEEDVAINVFRCLCDGVENGRFDQLDDRDELWKLLVVMTRHQSKNQIRHQMAQKRGGSQVRGHSVVGERGFDHFFDDDPTAELLVELQEEQEKLLRLLEDDSHRRIANCRLQGYTIEETAARLDISTRSVKRKLALIRETWLLELAERDP